MFRTTMLAVTVALSSGCVSAGIYPDEWAEKTHVSGGGCPPIGGEYANEGETFQKFGDRIERIDVGLFEELGQGIVAIDAVADFVSLRLELVDDTLKVTGNHPDGTTASFERPIEGCGGSMVNVETDWTHSLQEPGGAEVLGMTFLMVHWFERTAMKLARAEDGSLLMRKSEAGSVMFYWMPVLPGGQSEWIRFSPAASAPAQVARATEE